MLLLSVIQADPDTPVLTAGDPERTNMKKCDEMGGIPYHINVVNYMVRAAPAAKEYFIYQLIFLLFQEYCRKMLNTISQNSFFFHYFVKPTIQNPNTLHLLVQIRLKGFIDIFFTHYY